jgi:hypothetical protein
MKTLMELACAVGTLRAHLSGTRQKAMDGENILKRFGR